MMFLIIDLIKACVNECNVTDRYGSVISIHSYSRESFQLFHFVEKYNMDNDIVSESPLIHDFLPPVSVGEDYNRWANYWQTHGHTYEIEWRCDFLIFDETPLLPRPVEVSRQVARTQNYRCECKGRSDHNRYFCYTLSGIGGFKDQDGTYRVPQGHAFLVEVNNPLASYYYPPDATEPWQFLAFTFHGLQADVMVRALLRDYGPIYQIPLDTKIITKLLGYMSHQGAHTRFKVAQANMYEAVEIVMELLMTLMASKQHREGTAQAEDMVQQALDMITEDTTQRLRVNDIAERIGVSREHLSRLFQTRLGKSPRTFIIEQKMRRACLLLKESDMPIKTIASQLGYTAYPNFSQSFKQFIHTTPQEFRLNGSMNQITFSPQTGREEWE